MGNIKGGTVNDKICNSMIKEENFDKPEDSRKATWKLFYSSSPYNCLKKLTEDPNREKGIYNIITAKNIIDKKSETYQKLNTAYQAILAESEPKAA